MRKILLTSIVTALLLTACAAQGKTTVTQETVTHSVMSPEPTKFVLPVSPTPPPVVAKAVIKETSEKETKTAKAEPVKEVKESSVSQHLANHMVKNDLPDKTATRYANYIVDASDEYEVDPFTILAVMHVETGGTFKFADHPNSHGAIGLMQILQSNAKGMGVKVSQLYDPETNIALGTKYLSYLQGRFGNDLGITAYNWGEGNVAKGNYNSKYFNHVHRIFKSIEGNDYATKSSSAD